ncbi:hypothetical protein Tco_0516978 [Tanacetum coccineum]
MDKGKGQTSGGLMQLKAHYLPKAKQSTKGTSNSPKMTSFVEDLNVENVDIEEEAMGNKITTTGTQEEEQSYTLLGLDMVTKSLLEKWRETIVHDDYDPYDDDMYEGQKIPDNVQTICYNLDIKICGQKNK